MADQASVNRAIELWLNQGFGRDVVEAKVNEDDKTMETFREEYGKMSVEQLRDHVKFLEQKREIVKDLSVDELRALVAGR